MLQKMVKGAMTKSVALHFFPFLSHEIVDDFLVFKYYEIGKQIENLKKCVLQVEIPFSFLIVGTDSSPLTVLLHGSLQLTAL